MCVIIGGTRNIYCTWKISSVDNPMMEDSLYPYKNPRGLSDASYRSQWLSYPVWSVGNYEQKTNNVVIGEAHVMEHQHQLICVEDFMKKSNNEKFAFRPT